MNAAPSRRQALHTLTAMVSGIAGGLAGCTTGAGIGAGLGGDGAGAAAEPLDAIGRRRGLRVGSALGFVEPGSPPRHGVADTDLRALIARECGLLVCENEMKWAALRPSAERFDFHRADQMLAWAAAQGLRARGHTLLWMDPVHFPAWLNAHPFAASAAQARAEAEALLAGHIQQVVGRYNTIVDSWDVVNEAVDPATGGLRRHVLADRLGGLETVALAFHQARAAAPQAQLVYNDYMGWGPGSARHRAGVLTLLAGLKRRGVPVDALGIQGHVGTAGDGSALDPQGGQEREWRRFLAEVSDLGLDLLITEFDVNDRYLAADAATRDTQVAAIARQFLDITLDQRNLHALVFWGLADPLSWLQGRWPRSDGSPKRPLPFDATLRPKPLRDAVAQALQAMPVRQPRRPPAPP